MKILPPLLAVLLLVLTASTRAQSPADEAAKKLLADWDAFEVVLRGTERTLADLQSQFNGAAPAQREGIRNRYKALRSKTIEDSKKLLARIDAFITQHPDNVAMRTRRLEDRVFTRLDPEIKAGDAEALYRITGDGRYLHQAADLFSKSYEYEKAAELWSKAVELAPSYAALKNLGDCLMQTERFAEAQSIFDRAAERAESETDRREGQKLRQLAARYVARFPEEQEFRESGDDNPLVEIVTDRGRMVAELFEDQAPNTVANFIELAEKKFYDGLSFHRCMAYFMIQGGDPEGNGQGGPGYRIKDEYARPDARLHYRGTLSMANTNRPDTNGSQFFVTNSVTHWLNGKHTVFGRVIEGLEVAEVMPLDPTNKAAPFKIESVRVLRKRDHDYTVEKIEG